MTLPRSDGEGAAAFRFGPIARGARAAVARTLGAPLYVQIAVALCLGVVVGVWLGPDAAGLMLPGQLVLRLLGALAPPLILCAIVHALINAQFGKGVSLRLVGLLLLNTLVAIAIGLLVANLLRPGEGAELRPPEATVEVQPKADPLTTFLDNVPKSVLGPLTDNGKVLGVIFLALAFGLALRHERERKVATPGDLVELLLACLVRILHWVITLVPLAVFGIIASIAGTQGFAPFRSLGFFILGVLLALSLHACYYLTRIRFGSWARPLYVLRGVRDALVMAFSTASSTATMPVTYSCLIERVGLREQSASLGALVGANFNNDGTALYEAMAALFVAQMLEMHLGLAEQFLVVVTSVLASVGAAGIPEAGLVTMTLVFKAVGLPTEHIAVLLAVDWFLDRCRTTINVLGDINVSCLLDGARSEEGGGAESSPGAPDSLEASDIRTRLEADRPLR